MKLISWNVAGWVSKNKQQIEALFSQEPDIICLQEVRKKTLANFHTQLEHAGYNYIDETVSLAEKSGRIKGNLTASLYPAETLPGYIPTPHLESVLSSRLQTPIGSIDVHNAHVPNGSSYGWKKIETFEAIYQKLSNEKDHLRIVCGDFNSPQAEFPSGETITWGQRIKKNSQVVLGERDIRWHEGEYSVIRGLEEYNLVDAFRVLHGYQVEAYSFVVRRKGEIVSKRRFDHIFSSKELNVQKCDYLYPLLDSNLSDHAPIEVVFPID